MSGPVRASRADTLTALRRGDLAGARELFLPGGLAEFPQEIFGLADSLEVLDLGGGNLTSLPAELGRLKKLRVLFLSGNRFERMPPALGDCPALSQIGLRGAGLREVPGEALPAALRWLTLTDNTVEELPAALGERPHLQKLLLAGNRLRALPEGLANARGLELIRLAANRFEALPAWLATLPSLAWLSYAGNPLERVTPLAGVAAVSWNDVTLGERLGEGASGITHRASWRAAGETRSIALKLFKGAMTSDGLPDREVAACLAAGEHPHLASGIGRLAGHPDGVEGLAMRLLPSHWHALAGPPSLASCSRDVYDPALCLGDDAVRRLARAAASAAAHLHGRGLLHGDLYAHNLLWDGEAGEAVLSDFGAASWLPPGSDGAAFQRIEVRAWGLLLGELLALGPAPAAALQELQRACSQAEPAARPLMGEVVAALDAA
ncbi:leucine-rich repeat-containing protein kinase family protein [Methylobacterium sp. C25]|uniref:leucine-rich repeat-containing protein kinase family protein n=1 Tax=Methylobacterium sp. C25 TaxID=2721622 RepID=UPI001F391495|nr:leucine-rich repeat-containing protein kinase family protein [Methylobacterium sp. C25]